MTATTPRRTRQPRRGAALVLVAGTLALLAVASVLTAPSAPSAVATSAAAVGVGTESSAAYCAGLEDDPGVVSSEMAVADLAGAPRTLEVTTSSTEGRVAHRLVRLAAGRVAHLDPASLLAGSMDAMSIVANGGGVAATESLTGPDGTAVAPCLTQSSPTWSFGGGSTESGQSLVVAVFNPTTTSAQVTVTFLTPAGPVEPLRYRGLVLGPHRVIGLRVHDVAPNEAPITTQVATTSGNVVAVGVGASTKGAADVSLVPGAPAPAGAATFPISPNHAGVTTKLLLVNVGAGTASGTVSIAWPGCGAHCGTPFAVAVAAGTSSLLQVAPSTRSQLGVPMMARLVVTAPGLVVVQRVRTSRSLGQSAPLDDPTRTGSSALALVDPTGSGFKRVTIANAGQTPATVTLQSPGTHGPVSHQTVTVPANGVVTVPGTRLAWDRGVVELACDAPVYASGQVRDAVLGSDLLVAVPLV